MKRFWNAVFAFFVTLSLLAPSIPTANAETNGSIEGKIGPYLQDKLVDATGLLEVIVTFEGDGAPSDSNLDLLKNSGVDTGVTMQSLPIAGVLATAEQVKKLAQNDDVRSIYLNRQLKYFNYDATALTGVDKVRTDDTMRKENGGLPVTGKGVGVVVNDSGIDATHNDLKYGDHVVQNVMGTSNLHSLSDLLPITYTENVINTDSNSGHGTHVAGTVGGTGAMSAGKYEGVAPGADLVGYGSGAALFILDAVGGFDYAITHQSQYGIRVITNSWGSSGGFDPDGPVNVASKKAYDRGITVLFAAGNSGPGEDTHNPYAKAPWVISVAAGEKDGTLADFSSRGTKGVGGTFTVDGETWTWQDRPTITAPGVDIISTRVLAPVSSLGADKDAELIEPAYLPYYTTMSGTSMATPHVAGIVALMLEANPLLSPTEVKEILQKTATNMPGYEAWEAGAGYVNAYAAVDAAFNGRNYGETLNLYQQFNSSVDSSITRQEFTVDYNPVTFVSDNQYEFTVEEGLSSLVAKVNAKGVLEETGNTINLVLIAPDGTEYSSGIYVAFTLYTDRTVSVNAPQPGTWKVELRGLQGAEENPAGTAAPETVHGTLTFKKASGFSGLNDIDGHPAEAAIKTGISERLFDGEANGDFNPDQYLTRSNLAHYLVMGAGVRQHLPMDGSSISDVKENDLPFVEAVTAKGAAIRDRFQVQNGVMLPTADGEFSPQNAVTRAELAYSLVQSLGLQSEATDAATEQVTVQYGEERITIEDSAEIPTELKGYVQLALDLNILNAYFSVSQGPYDLEPTVHAVFEPNEKVTRADYAVASTRFFSTYLN